MRQRIKKVEIDLDENEKKKRGRKAFDVPVDRLPDDPPPVLEDELSQEAYRTLAGYLRNNPKIQLSDLEILVIAARQKARLDQLSKAVAKLKREIVVNKDGAYPQTNPLYQEIRSLEKDYRSTLRELNLTPAARASKREPLSEQEKAAAGASAAGKGLGESGPMARLFGHSKRA